MNICVYVQRLYIYIYVYTDGIYIVPFLSITSIILNHLQTFRKLLYLFFVSYQKENGDYI